MLFVYFTSTTAWYSMQDQYFMDDERCFCRSAKMLVLLFSFGVEGVQLEICLILSCVMPLFTAFD